ncbi:PKD domain-containing protein [Taibaiella soli]|uniref:PKD domain-containing protein n=1 Tax=Taibaiella soli TaxID=1649169 RepID=A0A2W2AFE0_9BACT|nr:PKD domain-containing protein [Taibaiella soli]PZF74011.1 hypothetical protein DN068_05300 [Taibaiella soli]
MNTTFTRKLFLYCILLLTLSTVSLAQTASFTVDKTSGCEPLLVTFTNTSTGTSAGTNYQWSFGNNANATNPTGTISTSYYVTSGYSTAYTATLTVTYPNGSVSTATQQITVYASPIINFTASDTAGCPWLTTTFTSNITWNSPGTGTITGWDFGDGTSPPTAATVTHSYNSGYYSVTLIAKNSANCTTFKTDTNLIHVYNQPVANYTISPSAICNVPSAVTFTNTSTGFGPFTAAWSFGDNSSGTGSPVSHTYSNAGNYSTVMIVTDGHGCKDTANIPLPAAQVTPDFQGPTEACVDEPVTFNQTTSPPVISYSWDFGDGASASGFTAPHVYTTAGTYTVTMTAFNGGCSVTKSKTIVIHPKPVINFTASPLNPCPSPTPIQFTNGTTGATSYTWNFGDYTATSNQTDPLHTYMSDANFDVKLVATTQYGCKDSLTKYSYIKINPFNAAIMADKLGGCIPVTINFSSNSNGYPYAVTSQTWDFGDGTSGSTQSAVQHTYPDSGTYYVTLTLHTANGCSKILTQTVHCGVPPTANFSAAPLVACVKEPVQFFDSSSTNTTNWEWDFGEGNSSQQNPTHAYSIPGTYTVKLTAYNNGCPDSMVKTNYVHINFPKSKATFSYSCDTALKVNFTNNSLGATGWLWDFGDGTTGSSFNASHTYPAIGNYTALLITWNDTTGCHDTLAMQLTIVGLVPYFSTTDTNICRDRQLKFTSSVTGGAPTRYDWTVNGSTWYDTTANFDYKFVYSGIYTVAITVRDIHDCYQTYTRTNYIHVGWPSVNFSVNPSIACAPANVLFTDQTTDIAGNYTTARVWDLGIGSPISSPNSTTVTQLYTAAGNYTIKLKVTDNFGCTDSLTLIDYLKVRKPVANYSATNPISCPGKAVFFLNNSQGSPLHYQWDFGDGTSSTQTNPNHIYNQLGTFTVKLVAIDSVGGCRDSIVKLNYITIVAKPTAAFTMSDTFRICPPLVVNFTNNTVGGSSYFWDFGDNGNSILQTPSHVYNSGIFVPKLIATNAYGCTDTATGKVRVLGYSGELSYTPLSGCAPLTVNFTALEQNVPGFIFDFSDGHTTPTNAQTTTHTYTTAGTYIPKLIMTDNAGCSAISVGLDTIKVDGVIGGFTFTPYPACNSGTLTFIDTSHGTYSTINSTLWVFHDGVTSTAASPTHSYNGVGTYAVTLIHTTTTGCKDTLHSDVTFYPLPTIDAGLDTTICLGDSAILMPAGGVTYTWMPAGSLDCDTCTHPHAGPTASTLYTVTGKDIHGCASTDTVRVSIKTKTTASFSANGEICEGDTIQLHVYGGQVYNWTPPLGLDNAHIADPVAHLDTTVNYVVIVSEGSCIPDTGYINVLVHPRPHVDAGQDQTMVAGNSVQLSATGNHIVSYAWTPPESLNCNTCADPEATPKSTTDYVVRAYTDYGCHDSDNVTVHVICQSSQVYIPNTFIPNGNGTNDRFYPRGRGIRQIKLFRIYDRWGEMIFERKNIDANDYNNAWDGTFNGKELSPDVYVYTIDGVCDTGEEFSWQGDISLIR